MSEKILVTGASGFLGRALIDGLCQRHWPVKAVFRNFLFTHRVNEQIVMGEIDDRTDWSSALGNVQVVVHLAARVHVMRDKAVDPLNEFRKVNVLATVSLARQAAKSGVKRFVFLSSVKVNGEFTENGRPFTADDIPAPADPYGISKLEAEQLLRQVAAETGMELVIIRPPLVYGPGVKANFESMMRWLARGVPLPLAAVTENRRSLVALENLVDLIVTCLNHPAAANQTLLVSDGEDLSTADLLKRTGSALGHPARLFYMPSSVLSFGAFLLNRPGIYHRVCGSLQLDITKTCQLLGWSPPVSVDEGLRRAAAGFSL